MGTGKRNRYANMLSFECEIRNVKICIFCSNKVEVSIETTGVPRDKDYLSQFK